MSQPPPYGQPPRTNPDTRQLPPGWITQFDANYNAWFYVNTFVQPPVTTWTHPLGAPPSPAPSYGPPQGPPPGQGPPQQQGSPYPGGASPYPGQASPYPGSASPYPQQQGGYGQPPPGQYSPYGQPPPQQYQNPPPQDQGGRGPLSGLFGGSSQQQQQPVYGAAQPPPQKQGMGLGTGLALGAGGLLGGVLLAEAFDGHDGGDGGGFFGGDDGGDGIFPRVLFVNQLTNSNRMVTRDGRNVCIV
ncbi:hypothetical protein C8R45DRAFT_244664 [Mycena sanguinolenta]|nr:hypothetical protein C8R45DRAFT_244664 [Mycena sanguinolenta]